MSDDQNENPPGWTTGKYAYVSSLYFVSVAVLYLWGYWSPFDVNVLEYASFTDIIKTAAYPIAPAFIATVVGVMIGDRIFSRNDQSPPDATTRASTGPRRVQHGRFINFLARHTTTIVWTYFVAVALLWLFGPPMKWAMLPLLLTIPTSIAASSLGLFKNVIRNSRTRELVLFLLAALPFLAYGNGVTKADHIRTGREYRYVVGEIAQASNTSSMVEQRLRLRFIGHVGGLLFFYNPANSSTVVVGTDEAKALEFKAYRASDGLSTYDFLALLFGAKVGDKK